MPLTPQRLYTRSSKNDEGHEQSLDDKAQLNRV